MKTFCKVILCAAAGLALLCGCNGGSGKADPADQERQLAGGYTAQREPSEAEIAMFNSVTAGSETVYTPLSVATQVVAGLNYKFWCRYEEKSGSGHCWVVIYKPLQGEPKVTSVTKE